MSANFEYIPLQPGQKRPLATDWQNRHFSREAYAKVTANFGVKATDELCILESDNVEELKRLVGAIPSTYTTSARANRACFYFLQTPASRAAGNMDVFGIFEFKQNRHYVVCEGSIHPDTKAPYACIDGDRDNIPPIPDWLVAKLQQVRKDAPPRSSAAEGRHPAIKAWCAKNFRGAGVDDEAFIQGAIDFDAENNSPCRGWKHSAEIAQWFIDNNKEPAGTGPKVVLRADLPEATTTKDHRAFILAAHSQYDDGPFPIGSLHIMAGNSGVGKTITAISLALAQRARQRFMGRDSFGHDFLFVLQDRTARMLRRTFDHMRLDMSTVPYQVLTREQKGMSPARGLANVFSKLPTTPKLILMEGLDMWMSETTKLKDASDDLDAVTELADHYDVSIIGTVGSPKKTEKEQYPDPRQMTFGSIAFGRKADTMIWMTTNKDKTRNVKLMLRNGDVEDFTSRLVDGRAQLTLVGEEGPKDHKPDAFAMWAHGQGTFTVMDVRLRFKVGREAALNLIARPEVEVASRGQSIHFRWVCLGECSVCTPLAVGVVD